MKTTLITLGSVTNAVKAKKLLGRYGIRAKLVKSNSLKKGCSYAIEIKDVSVLDAAAILRSEGITYSLQREEKK